MADSKQALSEIAKLQGIDTVAYARALSKAKEVSGTLIPYQTGLSFDPSRDTDTTATKDGGVTGDSSLETDVEVDFINNTSAIADAMYDSLFDGEVLEVWIIYRKRRNTIGQYFAWYLRAKVSEDSNDNDADDLSTREVSFAVDGTPKRGWVTLSDEQQAELDYVFRGVGQITDADETGQGTAWQASDAGVNVDQTDAEAVKSAAAASSAAASQAAASSAAASAAAAASGAASSADPASSAAQ